MMNHIVLSSIRDACNGACRNTSNMAWDIRAQNTTGNNHEPVSSLDKISYRKISQNLEPPRLC